MFFQFTNYINMGGDHRPQDLANDREFGEFGAALRGEVSEAVNTGKMAAHRGKARRAVREYLQAAALAVFGVVVGYNHFRGKDHDD